MSSVASEALVLPNFTVKNVTLDTVTDMSLADLDSGLILYFYPRDNTAGCSTQALDFTSELTTLSELGYIVIGVSRDSVKSHQNFISKKEIGFGLISDPNEVLCQYFNVIHEKNMYGKIVLGIQRSTFIFDNTGQLQHALRNIRAKDHVTKILSLLAN